MNNETSLLHQHHAKAVIWSVLHYICYHAAQKSMHHLTHERLYERMPDYTHIFNLSVKGFLLENDLSAVLDQLIELDYDAISARDAPVRGYVGVIYPGFELLIKAGNTEGLFKKLIEAVRMGSNEAVVRLEPLDFKHPCDECDALEGIANAWANTRPHNERARLLAEYVDHLNQFAQALPGYKVSSL